MVDRTDFFAEPYACKPADDRHQRLKESKTQRKLQRIPHAYAPDGKAARDGHGECIHGQPKPDDDDV